jgi:asparagine synthetase B (glutamine-hydrolysing)
VSDAIGATPCIWNFDPDHAAEHVVDSLWSLDEPIAGYAVPVWCIYRELRNHRVIVSLDGHGADELLGGYSWYLDWLTKDVNANLYRDFHALLLPAILRNFDRSSSAHGIEVRMPFMDWRLVTFAFALSYQAKFGGGYTKRILRDAMVGIVPQQILTRRSKIGFNVPITDWFNSGLRPLIERVMNHPRWLESPYFDGPTLREQVSTMSRAQAWRLEHWDTAFQISKLVNLTIWQILFIDRERGVLE